MKKILLIIAICISYISTAQNLESKIPNTAKAVVSINGDRLFELVSTSDFNKYDFVKKMFKELNRKNDSTKAFASIEDFGFNISSKAYYFYTNNDSVSYHPILLKLTDKNKFESLFPNDIKDKIERKDNVNIMTENKSVTIWDDKMLVLSFGDKSNYAIDNNIVNGWTKQHVASIFNGSSGQSIITNKSYLASRDKNAVASAWINNYGELIGGTMSSMYGMAGMKSLSGTGLKSSLYGFKFQFFP